MSPPAFQRVRSGSTYLRRKSVSLRDLSTAHRYELLLFFSSSIIPFYDSTLTGDDNLSPPDPARPFNTDLVADLTCVFYPFYHPGAFPLAIAFLALMSTKKAQAGQASRFVCPLSWLDFYFIYRLFLVVRSLLFCFFEADLVHFSVLPVLLPRGFSFVLMFRLHFRFSHRATQIRQVVGSCVGFFFHRHYYHPLHPGGSSAH